MTPVPVTTTLQATCISEGLRLPLELEVRSIHRSALNLIGGDGALLTVADARTGGLPGGILVAAAGLDLRSMGAAVGMPAVLTADRLDVGPGRLVVRLVGARRWSPRIPGQDPSAWPARAAATHTLARAASAPGSISSLPIARAALEGLGAAIGAGDRAAAVDTARRLVGLGPGLTPSGDDALTGVLAALHVAGHPGVRWFAAALDDLDARTTTVAAAMLRHALDGAFAERIHALLAALLAPAVGAAPAPALDAAIRATVAWGATSGSDLLAGVLTGLDAATGVIGADAGAADEAEAA